MQPSARAILTVRELDDVMALKKLKHPKQHPIHPPNIPLIKRPSNIQAGKKHCLFNYNEI